MTFKIKAADGRSVGRSDIEVAQDLARRQAPKEKVAVVLADLIPIEPAAVQESLRLYASGATQRVSVYFVDGKYAIRDGTNMARHLLDSGATKVEAELAEADPTHLKRYRWLISIGRTVGTIPVDQTKADRQKRYEAEDAAFNRHLSDCALANKGVLDAPPPGEPDWVGEVMESEPENAPED